MGVAGEQYHLYHYKPSLVAAIVFIVLFSITTGLHAVQLIRKRTWYFIPFLIGGIFEFIGYIARAINATEPQDNWSLGPYIVESLFILLAPAFFAASIYMILGRIIVLTGGEALSPIRVNWLTKIFVAGDVISWFAQSGGGGILASAKTQASVNTGQNVITGGLALQVLSFGLFIITSAIFNMRIRKNPTATSQTLNVPWQSFMYVLYAASALILIRSTFRIVEYVMGQDGVLLDHEYYLYIFDSVLMFITMVILNVWHPSRIIANPKVGAYERDLESSERESGVELRHNIVYNK